MLVTNLVIFLNASAAISVIYGFEAYANIGTILSISSFFKASSSSGAKPMLFLNSSMCVSISFCERPLTSSSTCINLI